MPGPFHGSPVDRLNYAGRGRCGGAAASFIDATMMSGIAGQTISRMVAGRSTEPINACNARCKLLESFKNQKVFHTVQSENNASSNTLSKKQNIGIVIILAGCY